MKKFILLIIASTLSSSLLYAQNSRSTAEDMANLISSMKSYTLALAEQMPADKFDYRPSESDEIRTFARHYKHMKNFMGFQLLLLKNEPFDFGKLLANNKAYESSNISKKQIINDLSEMFDNVISFYENTTDKELKGTYKFVWEPTKPDRSRLLITMALRDHISHHRAQSIIYLRENGIKPVQYQRY